MRFFVLPLALWSLLTTSGLADDDYWATQKYADSEAARAYQYRSVRTYADLEAALARNRALYEQSQLSPNPEHYLDSSSLRDTLFYQLPLSERALVVITSFSAVELDGEYSERMQFLLRYRTNPYLKKRVDHAPTSDDKAYTKALFKTIDGYSASRLRKFCGTPESYALFQKNLKRWKKDCDYVQ